MAREFPLTDEQVTILSNLSLMPLSAFYEDQKLIVLDEAEADVLDAWLDGTDWAPQAVLEILKSRLRAAIDAAAEVERLKYITPGAGQAMTYQQKMEEVRALAVDADPDPADYPLLAAEVGITAPTLSDVAAVVLAAYQQWQQAGAAIEGTRLGAKAAIDAAETGEAAHAAAAVEWPNT